jgi:PAS domain S-box-containing protein
MTKKENTDEPEGLKTSEDYREPTWDSDYASLVQNAVEGILEIDAAGRIMTANPAAVTLLDYASVQDLVADGLGVERHFYIEPADRARLTGPTKHEVVNLQCRVYSKNGMARWVSLKIVPVRNAAGALARRQIFVQDHTAEKLLQEMVLTGERRYHSLIENALYGIYRSSLDGRILEANHALVAMLGYESREELLSVHLDHDVYLTPGERGKLVQQYGEVERISGVTVWWKRKDGTPIAVRLSGRKMRDGAGVLEGFEVIAEPLQQVQDSGPRKKVAHVA